MLIGGIDWTEVGGICAVATLLIGGGALGGKIVSAMRAPGKSRQAAAATTNKDIFDEITKVRTEVAVVKAQGLAVEVALNGRPPTMFEPDPPPGIIGIVDDHTRVLEKLETLLPNGGDSNSPGDLNLRMAQRAGVVKDDPSIP